MSGSENNIPAPVYSNANAVLILASSSAKIKPNTLICGIRIVAL